MIRGTFWYQHFLSRSNGSRVTAQNVLENPHIWMGHFSS